MKLALAAMFALTAAVYASVGFGGGSTYNALLVVTGADYRVIPLIALACNVVVVSGNVIRYGRAGLLNLRPMALLLAFSIPCAWIGGRIPVSEFVFVGLLGAALAYAGGSLLWPGARAAVQSARGQSLPLWMAPVGGAVGLVSGLVGIGGGIFLAPALHWLRWAPAKEIAAAASVFILVNSIAGAGGQLAKLSDMSLVSLAVPYWPLIPAVLAGGFIGNRLGVSHISQDRVRQVTGVLILVVAARLLWRFANMAIA